MMNDAAGVVTTSRQMALDPAEGARGRKLRLLLSHHSSYSTRFHSEERNILCSFFPLRVYAITVVVPQDANL